MLVLSVSRISSKPKCVSKVDVSIILLLPQGHCKAKGRINPVMVGFILKKKKERKKKVWLTLFRNRKLILKWTKQNSSKDGILNERDKYRMIIACDLVDESLF